MEGIPSISSDAGGVLCCIVQPEGLVSFCTFDGDLLFQVAPDAANRSKVLQDLKERHQISTDVPIAISQAHVLAWRSCCNAISTQSSSQELELLEFDDGFLVNALMARLSELF